ncbi:MAG: tetratricopeptide repeat protein [Ignavibacteriaceae bacterium]|jgi:Flp pilus assembly protein TadD
MKIKFSPVVFYSVFIMLAVAVMVIYFTVNSSDSADPKNQGMNEMPDDEMHRNFKHPETGGGEMNLRPDVMAKLNDLKKSVEDSPNDTLKMRELADFYFESHKPDDAMLYYNKILAKDSRRTDILHNMTNIYYTQKEFGKAEEVTKRILTINKDDVFAHYNLGAIYATAGNKEDARKIWNEILKKYPQNPIKELIKESLSQIK